MYGGADGFGEPKDNAHQSTAGAYQTTNTNTTNVSHNLLPKLPPIHQDDHKWSGDVSMLAHWLRKFKHNFGDYPDMQALAFLMKCIAKRFHHSLELCTMLDEALNKLSLWTSDSKIHTERVEVQLRGL